MRPADYSATVINATTGTVLLSQHGNTVRSTASVPKLVLLAELAERIVADPHQAKVRLTRRGVDAVGDSGIWQHLLIDELAVRDIATLVATVSDNLATNVLIQHVGLDAVARRGCELGLRHTALHDIVRNHRDAATPERLSSGTTDELANLMTVLFNDMAGAGSIVLDWMTGSVDLSMVGSAFGLDPLAHAVAGNGVQVWSKTGTDIGVRADVGIVRVGSTTLAYAAVVNWQPSDAEAECVEVLNAMRRLGNQLLSYAAGASTSQYVFG